MPMRRTAFLRAKVISYGNGVQRPAFDADSYQAQRLGGANGNRAGEQGCRIEVRIRENGGIGYHERSLFLGRQSLLCGVPGSTVRVNKVHGESGGAGIR